MSHRLGNSCLIQLVQGPEQFRTRSIYSIVYRDLLVGVKLVDVLQATTNRLICIGQVLP